MTPIFDTTNTNSVWQNLAAGLVLLIAGLDIESTSSSNPVVLRFGSQRIKPSLGFLTPAIYFQMGICTPWTSNEFPAFASARALGDCNGKIKMDKNKQQ